MDLTSILCQHATNPNQDEFGKVHFYVGMLTMVGFKHLYTPQHQSRHAASRSAPTANVNTTQALVLGCVSDLRVQNQNIRG